MSWFKSKEATDVRAYCVKCRKTVDMIRISDAEFSNGKKAFRGSCCVCGKTLYRIKQDKREGMW